MEQGKKQEYIERLTLELLAYDNEAVDEAVKCQLSIEHRMIPIIKACAMPYKNAAKTP